MIKWLIPLIFLVGCAVNPVFPEREPIKLDKVELIEGTPQTTPENIKRLVDLHNDAADIANNRAKIVKALDIEAAGYQRISIRNEVALENELRKAWWTNLENAFLQIGIVVIGIAAFL